MPLAHLYLPLKILSFISKNCEIFKQKSLLRTYWNYYIIIYEVVVENQVMHPILNELSLNFL